ncbi:anaerobic C4-dicarboxylate transporter DcuC [Deltaproteobacteria bacterium]|nr:anaerobic C4-dicarboxylate transporter DcuC [Deltaproteobacteria bacterium]
MLEWLLLKMGISAAAVSSIMLWVGVVVILGVIYLMIKQKETRLVLIGAGFLLCFLSVKPMTAFASFETAMVNSGLIKTILSVMGFAYVMKLTKCDAHLVNLMVSALSGVKIIIVPAVVLVTAFINISLASAAGCSAAVGAVMIPLMMSLGVHPAVAASAVMAGTFGSMLSPGLTHNAFIATDLMKNGDVMAVIFAHWHVSVICVVIGAVSLTVFAFLRKELSGHTPDAVHKVDSLAKPNVLFAAIPVLPVVLLALSAYVSSKTAPEWGKNLLVAIPWFKSMSVPTAMLIGTLLGLAATRTNPTTGSKEFFKGMGDGYASVMGIIIAAGVFVAGMQAAGLVNALLASLKSADELAKYASAFGPFLLAIITGSGDAATLAFNTAVTPHAEQFGMGIIQMGSLATLGGCLGRTMSPLAGAAIVCAGLAGVNPLEIAKRNAPGMIIAAVVAMLMLG